MSFQDSFWTKDYIGGVQTVYDKLQQGIHENQEVLNLVSSRITIEEGYGQRLQSVRSSHYASKVGFGRDEGATLKQSYEGMILDMSEEGYAHYRVASALDKNVRSPFAQWSEEHKLRVTAAWDSYLVRQRSYEKQLATTKSLQRSFFAKCAAMEDLTAESNVAFPTLPQSPKADGSDSFSGSTAASTPPSSSASAASFEPVSKDTQLGGETYSEAALKMIFTDMINEIPLKSLKVPILGTYKRVSTGDQIVMWLRKNMDMPSIATAEKFGQDLLAQGYIRLVGQVGNRFGNASSLNYQWQDSVMAIVEGKTEAPEPKVEQTTSHLHPESPTPSTTSTLSGYIKKFRNQPQTDPIQARAEMLQFEQRYKEEVEQLERLRFELEENILEVLAFFEKCELGRLAALKRVMQDFGEAISKGMEGTQTTAQRVAVYHESIQPIKDIRYTVERYKTGHFSPNPTAYRGYEEKVSDEFFGVELERQALAEFEEGNAKQVPMFAQVLLTQLDTSYSVDEDMAKIWRSDAVSLKETHQLKRLVDTVTKLEPRRLSSLKASEIIALLKLYLLELPDSVVSCNIYDLIRSAYSSNPSDEGQTARLQKVESTLSQLPQVHVDTLEAIIKHLKRFIVMSKISDEDVDYIFTDLARVIVRPWTQSATTMNSKHGVRFLRDLVENGDKVFGNLDTKFLAQRNKKNRQRNVSSSEQNRKALAEARQQAIESATKSRNSSPRRQLDDTSSPGIPLSVALSPARKRSDSTGTPNGAGTPRSSRSRHQQTMRAAMDMETPTRPRDKTGKTSAVSTPVLHQGTPMGQNTPSLPHPTIEVTGTSDTEDKDKEEPGKLTSPGRWERASKPSSIPLDDTDLTESPAIEHSAAGSLYDSVPKPEAPASVSKEAEITEESSPLDDMIETYEADSRPTSSREPAEKKEIEEREVIEISDEESRPSTKEAPPTLEASPDIKTTVAAEEREDSPGFDFHDAEDNMEDQ
ncbi:Rho-GTPase-activating protein 8 [Yarrowia sp. B02]|nr:Rho-GTPase-activating protein 8 [Yarrowia sp. B02]